MTAIKFASIIHPASKIPLYSLLLDLSPDQRPGQRDCSRSLKRLRWMPCFVVSLNIMTNSGAQSMTRLFTMYPN